MSQNQNRLARICNEVTGELLSRGYSTVANAPGGSPMVFAKKYTKLPGAPTMRDLEHIDATSRSDQEAKRRIMAMILENQDPGTPPEEQLVRQSDVDRIVNERVQQAVLAAMKTMEQSRADAEKPKPEPKTAPEPQDGEEDRRMTTWLPRAIEAGLPPPQPKPTDANQVDGRWLRRWGAEWTIKQSQKQTAPTES